MKTVYIKGQELKLTKEIGGGQEAVIYDAGNGMAVKIYRSPQDSIYAQQPLEQQAATLRLQTQQHKLRSYPKGLPKTVVTPVHVVTDKKGQILGYAMPLIRNAETLLQWSNKSFRIANNLRQQDVVTVLTSMHHSLHDIHAAQAVIGDFNDMNVMVQGRTAYFIDTDSWQFSGFPSTMFTERFVDPLLCTPTIIQGREMMTLSKAHTAFGDWYAFHVMAFKTLLYVDPYGGTYKPKDQKQKVIPALRPLHRINVFHPEVIYPKIAIPYSVLPDDLLHHFDLVFTKDQRGELPIRLLQQARWTTCTTCGTQHARAVCPSCKYSNPQLTGQKVQIRGTVKAQRLFHTKGVILYSSWQDGLKWLYHETDGYHREDGSLVRSGELLQQTRYRIHNYDTIFASGQTSTIVHRNGTEHQISTDHVGTLPIIDANQHHIVWAQGGNIYRNNPYGLEYTHHTLGKVIEDQTLLWQGNTWGFGLWRAGGLSQGFTFTNNQSLINDNISLPPLQGSIIDAITYCSDTHAWFCFTHKQGSKLINTCHVFDRKGDLITTEETSEGSDHWLGTIRGKGAAGPYLFSPTDAGIMRAECNGTTLPCLVKTYPDTEPFVDTQSVLHITPQGIYIQGSQEITLLTIS